VDGQIYETVVIGTQTWMKRNLNRNVEGSKCYSGFEAYCNIYGRLYDWETVMGGAASSPKYPSGVHGICPAGFHVPSALEWMMLTKHVGTDSKKLKAVIENGTISENGTDDYGFSALLAGYGEDNSFSSVGSEGYLWSATEGLRSRTNDTSAYYYNIGFSSALPTNDTKSNLYSLRCLKDFQRSSSSSSYTPVNCPNIPAGSFCDDRDGTTYKSVPIGNHTWMAENLNYNAENSLCYDEAQANCDLYGRLYYWETAVAVDPICNSSLFGIMINCNSYINMTTYITSSQHQGICPKGWHLPTLAERNDLVETAGGTSNAGQVLKATSGWSSNGNGLDILGFSALPGGVSSMSGSAGILAGWWYVRYGDNYGYGLVLDPSNGVSSALSGYYSLGILGLSIRCVQDSD
jgi:uncharacterized protein (TIGR02145 family)